MADFVKIETQEQLDAIIGERLTRERTKLEEKFKAYISPDQLAGKTKELTDQIAGLTQKLAEADTAKTEFEKTIAEKEAQIKKHETASVKSRIAHELGLGYEAINFIQGEDEATIKASAEALKGIIGKPGMPMANNDYHPEKDDKKAAMKQVLQNLKGE